MARVVATRRSAPRPVGSKLIVSERGELAGSVSGGCVEGEVVADARGRFATEDRLPNADEILVAWPEETLAEVEPDHATAIVVLTHDDKFDVPMLVGALESDAFYIGALGSRRNQERRRERLLEAGVDEASLERISGPAGLDIGAHTPAETAVSMIAEIMAVRAGRDGGRLKGSSGRIPAEGA